jgi:hypothetical protein
MNIEYPNLETVKHLIFLQDSSIPINNYPEIVNNILNKQYLEFVEKNRISTKQNNLTFSSNEKIL